MHEWNKNSTHHTIMRSIDWYEDHGYSFEKALKLTLRKKRHLLEEMLDDFDDYDDVDDEEDGDDDTDDNGDDYEYDNEESDDHNDDGDQGE